MTVFPIAPGKSRWSGEFGTVIQHLGEEYNTNGTFDVDNFLGSVLGRKSRFVLFFPSFCLSKSSVFWRIKILTVAFSFFHFFFPRSHLPRNSPSKKTPPNSDHHVLILLNSKLFHSPFFPSLIYLFYFIIYYISGTILTILRRLIQPFC
jgi:hypothetical protein